jgi:hypothetical protein
MEVKRTAIVLDETIQARVAKLAKEHKINQGQVIEVMLDMLADQPEFIVNLKEKREEKVSGRTSKTSLLKKLSKLSAEELEALAKNLKDGE